MKNIITCIVLAPLLLSTIACSEIPSCEQVACTHPEGNYEGDHIFTPVINSPADSVGGASR